MRRVHYSAVPLQTVAPGPAPQPTGMKPCGLWYTVETTDLDSRTWLEWCRAESFRWPDAFRSATAIEVDCSRILRLTPDDLESFTLRYGARWLSDAGPVAARSRGFFVDWAAIAAEFAGVEIFPWTYRFPMPMWFSSWDCASGCIWDPSAIVAIQQVDPPIIEEAELCPDE